MTLHLDFETKKIFCGTCGIESCLNNIVNNQIPAYARRIEKQYPGMEFL